jgi:hypothetical protein
VAKGGNTQYQAAITVTAPADASVDVVERVSSRDSVRRRMEWGGE